MSSNILNIRPIYLKILLHNKEIFYKINNKSYRKLTIKDKNKKKAIIISKIYVDSLTINARIDSENKVGLLMCSFLISEFSRFINIIFDKTLKIDNVNFNIIPFDYKDKFYFDINLVFGIKFIYTIIEFFRFNITKRGEKKIENRGNDTKYA